MKKLIQPIIFIAAIFSFASCASSILEEPSTDKKEIFKYAWKTIDERYSFFELKISIGTQFMPALNQGLAIQ